MDDYMGGDQPWWDALDKEKITQVKISDGITSIGSFAFCNFSNLQSVTIPESVISIGDCAFMACDSLENIKIPKKVKKIGESAFLSCYSLTSIELPSGIKCIEKMAFENTGLVSIEIPYGVKSIEERAFFYCDSLNSVTIPNSVTSIGSFAFANCYRLKNVIIPDSVTDIGDSAFADTGILSEVSCSNVNVNFDSFGIYSEYSNKIANADYIIAVVKDPNAEDILSAENLLYVDQFTADNDGKISVSLPVSSDTKDYETVLFGPEKTALKGDVNSDGKVGIDDVTYIQKYLANLAEFTAQQEALADVNKDGEVNIDDATLIQKHLVGMAVIE